jgi:hypothetical protein
MPPSGFTACASIPPRLSESSLKIRTSASHADLLIRFSQVRYRVVNTEERSTGNDITESRPGPLPGGASADAPSLALASARFNSRLRFPFSAFLRSKIP